MDVKDSRFDALFTSPDFALDPTNPRFKATEGAKSIQKEAVSRRGAVPVVNEKLEGLSTKTQATSKGIHKHGHKSEERFFVTNSLTCYIAYCFLSFPI